MSVIASELSFDASPLSMVASFFAAVRVVEGSKKSEPLDAERKRLREQAATALTAVFADFATATAEVHGQLVRRHEAIEAMVARVVAAEDDVTLERIGQLESAYAVMLDRASSAVEEAEGVRETFRDVPQIVGVLDPVIALWREIARVIEQDRETMEELGDLTAHRRAKAEGGDALTPDEVRARLGLPGLVTAIGPRREVYR